MESVTRADLLVMKPNPWMLGLAAAPLVLFPGLFASFGGAAMFAVLPQALIASGLLFSFLWKRRPFPRFAPAQVTANRHGVRIGKRFLSRDAIEKAFIVYRGSRVLLRVVPKGARPDVDLVVPSEAEGRRLLRAMGLDATQAVAAFRVTSRALANRAAVVGAAFAWMFLLSAFTSTFGHALGGRLSALGPVLTIALAIVFFWPAQLHIGADGVLLTWLWRRRFYGYDRIESVLRYESGAGRSRVTGVRLVLKDGDIVDLPVGPNNFDEDDRVGMILVRIEEACENYSGHDVAEEASVLRRGERSFPMFLEHLKRIGLGANAAHRTAPLRADRLWTVVEDPAQEPAIRAAAAIALAADKDAEPRQRLRAAAEATAAPKLRIALEAAADGDREAELKAALAELEAERIEEAG